MPYVGNPLANAFSSREKQDLTGQSGTSFTLTHSVSSPNDLSVYINHVRQEPTTAYTVNGTALTMTGSVAGTDDFYIIYDELAVQSISHPTNQALTATAGTFTSGLVGTTGTFSGAVSGTTGTFSGAVAGTTGTFSGDLTVDTSTLKVDSSNNRVGINTTIPNWTTEISNASTSTTLTGLTDSQLVLVNTGTATANQSTKLGFRFADGSYNGQAMICGVRESATSRAVALTFSSAPSADGDPDERMRINSVGNVGIGTSSPDAKLDVEGTTDAEVRITRTTASTSGTFNDAGSVLNLVNNVNYENGYNGGASVGQILFTSNDTSTGAGVRAKISCKATTYYHSENLQFFLSPPNTGTGQVSATSQTDGLRMEINSDGTLKVGADLKPAAWAIRGFNNHATHATLEGWNDNSSGKNLNLFRYDGASIFQVSNGGAVWAAGGYTSDKAYKNVIGDCTEGWSKLKDVQPKSYRYKRISNVEQEDGTTKEVFSDDDMDSNIHYGVIAQDLKKVLPDITYGEEGKMSVDYHGLLMVAINTIKELEARITALESK